MVHCQVYNAIRPYVEAEASHESCTGVLWGTKVKWCHCSVSVRRRIIPLFTFPGLNHVCFFKTSYVACELATTNVTMWPSSPVISKCPAGLKLWPLCKHFPRTLHLHILETEYLKHLMFFCKGWRDLSNHCDEEEHFRQSNCLHNCCQTSQLNHSFWGKC